MNKNTFEIINKIIPHRSPLVTNFVCKPNKLIEDRKNIHHLNVGLIQKDQLVKH